jgi:5-methylcytosine-specific restriction endonuclease McrA
MHKNVKAHYGKVTLIRTECPECQEMSIVIDGKTVCCGVPPEVEKPHLHERMTRGRLLRSQLTPSQKADILEKQENRCIYCDCDLANTWYISDRMKLPRKATTQFDHIIPHSFAPIGDVSNFAAACNICNLIKHSRIFESIERIRMFVMARRRKLGYKFL